MHTNYYTLLTHLSIVPSPRGAAWADLKKEQTYLLIDLLLCLLRDLNLCFSNLPSLYVSPGKPRACTPNLTPSFIPFPPHLLPSPPDFLNST